MSSASPGSLTLQSADGLGLAVCEAGRGLRAEFRLAALVRAARS